MPRLPRIDYPGLLQHVIVRGVARNDIFINDNDREDFIHRLGNLLRETQTQCLAWALLDNHFHLLIIPTTETLARIMRRLLTGYAVSFNLRHNRSGHLFQNRYKSIVCDSDAYQLELIRYIHLNPLRAGMVNSLDELDQYQWSGHKELIGGGNGSIIDKESTFSFFGRSKRLALPSYINFMADGLSMGTVALSSGGRINSQAMNEALGEDDLYDQRILGGGGFVEKVLATLDVTIKQQFTLPFIIERVAQLHHLTVDQLHYRSNQAEIVRAKSLICYLATRHHGITGKVVAEALAYSPAAVSRAAQRGEAILNKDRTLQCLMNEVN